MTEEFARGRYAAEGNDYKEVENRYQEDCDKSKPEFSIAVMHDGVNLNCLGNPGGIPPGPKTSDDVKDGCMWLE
jgi:hypothetical protein